MVFSNPGCNGLASHADAGCCIYCEICDVNRYVVTRFDVDSNFLSFCPWYNFAQLVHLLAVVVASPNFIKSRLVFM